MSGSQPRCIGVDLDNTLVCYDDVLARCAGRRGVAVAGGKQAIKDAVRRSTGELGWTLLQGDAYGPGMRDAVLFAGAHEVIARWRRHGHRVVVISHRTRFPATGEPHDLHAHAAAWVERWLGDLDVPVFFEQTRAAKLRRIGDERCTAFVDDLLDVLQDPEFPEGVQRIWFAPDASNETTAGVIRVGDWRDMPDPLAADANLESSQRAAAGADVSDAGPVFAALASDYLGTTLKSWEPLPGGINNLTARLRLTDGRSVIGKIYKPGSPDRRARRLRETRFLELLADAGIERVPRVLASDEGAQAALHTIVSGRPWTEERPVGDRTWAQFSAFMSALATAAARPAARRIGPAAEAARTLQQHLAFVHERRDRWRQRAIAGTLPAGVAERVLGELEDEYQWVAAATIAHVAFTFVVPEQALILTPSDFGLHNALVDDDGSVGLVDFEYAGWDDPLKTDIDFTCQPRFRSGRPERLPALDGYVDRASARARALRELLTLKWRYIILAAQMRQGESDDRQDAHPLEGHHRRRAAAADDGADSAATELRR